MPTPPDDADACRPDAPLPTGPADCRLYRPGHRVHWVQANRAARDPDHRPEAGRLVSTRADGTVVLNVAGDRRRLWTHDPVGLATAAAAAGGGVHHQPRWGLLLVPSGTGTLRTSVCVADADDPGRTPCAVEVAGATLFDRLLVAGGGTLSVEAVRTAADQFGEPEDGGVAPGP